MPYSRSSPSSKAAGEEVPMDANPAYGEVNIYDTVKEQKENWWQLLFSTVVWHCIPVAVKVCIITHYLNANRVS